MVAPIGCLGQVAMAMAMLACGARSGPPVWERVEDGAAAAAGAGVGGSGGEGGTASPPCFAWSVVPVEPLALTNPIGDSMLTSVAVDGARVFIASTNNNDPSPDPTWRVRVVSDDLATIGASQAVLTRPQHISYSGLGVAIRFGHRGAIAWDEANGCRFVALGADGSAAATATVSDSWCYWLYATSGGFVAMSSPLGSFAPLAMLALDPSGNVLAAHPNVVPPDQATTYPFARTRFDDGSILLAWTESPSTVLVQRFSETGESLSQPKALPSFGHDTNLGMASLGSSALVVWSPGDTSPGEVRLMRIDEDGNALGADTVLAAMDGVPVGRIDVAAIPGGALALWTKGPEGAYDTMTVQAVTNEGAAVGSTFAVPTPKFLLDVRLAVTPAGALVAYDAQLAGALTQVFVSRLVCGT
jgi:hypothetical protein